MSKYKDINNPLLLEKMRSVEPRKNRVKKFSAKEEVVMEVDLHIEKLNKFHKRMDSADILITQIDTAQQKLEYAIRNRIPNLVFIHGVGEGVLEKELKFLFGRYPVRYEPASYRKYGMGATAVYIIQNIRNQ
jgi:dsDNA-specific endonuclease/ATPase MutS2